ncbi:late lactation protein B-like [Gracilinanus agilis]|uniref:late lactation protein B-like n=1 Tax=Gracilinanus agilis TaxID=191870 RepID=UPI001CFC8989|nr:late lactation protein B-like [Gracilinanus agilis]
MKILFLTTALSLFAILQAEESTSTEKQFEGTYYALKMAANKDLPKEKEYESISAIIMSQLKDGHMEASFTIKKDGKCKEMKIKLEKTDDPKKFTIGEFIFLQFLTDEGKVHVHLTKMSEQDYWTLICEGEYQGQQVRVAKLMGPHKDINLEALNEFQEILKKEGLGDRRIVSPRLEESCTPEHA